MSILGLIIIATLITSLISLIGVFSLWIKESSLDKLIILLVALSAGALLSGAFFHLIPESLETLTSVTVFTVVMVGFILFFLMEKFLYWHHCHEGKCEVHPVSYLILLGDGLHNFIDGIIIATSFIISIPFGIITTALIIGHEIPQELGDFGVLVHGGFSKAKALFYNLLSQLACVVGGVIGYFLSTSIGGIIPYILPFAAGGFIYISASDLVPKLHNESEIKKSLSSFAFFILGVIIVLLIKFLAHH
tara:strand:- start:16 stop:759 length:744 start_codon:yes stop_codon:yes gene_type:complete